MSQHHDPIQDATARLAREVPPDRDLWPGIAARLDRPEASAPADNVVRPTFRPRQWGWMAAAAVLTLLVLVPSLRQSEQPTDVAALDRDYATVRDQVMTLVEARCQQLPSRACAPLLDGLATLDRSASGLSTALSALPTDSPERVALLARYRSTLDRAQDLRTRVARL